MSSAWKNFGMMRTCNNCDVMNDVKLEWHRRERGGRGGEEREGGPLEYGSTICNPGTIKICY